MTFGRHMLEHWMLDPDQTYLNHGTVGATPRRVLSTQQALRDEIERHPSRFLLRELADEMPMPWRAESRLREAIAPVAAFVGAQRDDIAFVPNVTYGINAAVAAAPLASGDEVLISELAYGAVKFTTTVYANRAGATVVPVEVPFPPRSSGEVIDAFVGAMTPRTKLAILDHITAQSALVLPVAAIAAECRRRGIAVIVDGAHAPGAIPVDIASLGVDWYAANLHKWAHAPRGCGFLWTAPERQAATHAPIVSWGRDRGFLEEFEHVATSDPTPCLAAPEGIALLHEWSFDACRGYMNDLAWRARAILTDRWGTQLTTPREMIGTMITVPLPETAGTTDEQATALRLALLVEDRVEVQLHAWRGRLWTRVSAQVYNDESDVIRLADAVARRA